MVAQYTARGAEVNVPTPGSRDLVNAPWKDAACSQLGEVGHVIDSRITYQLAVAISQAFYLQSLLCTHTYRFCC